MEDGLDRGWWTAADKHLGQAQVDVKRYIRPRALPDDSVHETKCRTFNKRWTNHKFSCEESRSWIGDARPQTEDGRRDFSPEPKTNPAGIGTLARHCHLWGLHTVFPNDGSKTPKRFFFISLDNFL